MSAYECPKCFNWVESPNHICYAGDPDRRGRAEQQAKVQRVLDVARAMNKRTSGPTTWPEIVELRAAIDALDASMERYSLEKRELTWVIRRDGCVYVHLGVNDGEAAARKILIALNAQERKP